MAFVHPAAAVPFLLRRAKRSFVDGPALVAGTVGADFEYFATLSARQRIHPDPLLTFVLGVVAALVVVAALSRAGPGLARALPRPLAARFRVPLTRPLARSRWGAVVVGVVAGAALHTLWDALTARKGALAAAFDLPWRSIHDVTTLAGIALLVLGIALAPRSPEGDVVVDGAWPRLLALCVAASVVGALALAGLRWFVVTGSVADATAGASGGALLGVFLAGLALRPRSL